MVVFYLPYYHYAVNIINSAIMFVGRCMQINIPSMRCICLFFYYCRKTHHRRGKWSISRQWPHSSAYAGVAVEQPLMEYLLNPFHPIPTRFGNTLPEPSSSSFPLFRPTTQGGRQFAALLDTQSNIFKTIHGHWKRCSRRITHTSRQF